MANLVVEDLLDAHVAVHVDHVGGDWRVLGRQQRGDRRQVAEDGSVIGLRAETVVDQYDGVLAGEAEILAVLLLAGHQLHKLEDLLGVDDERVELRADAHWVLRNNNKTTTL